MDWKETLGEKLREISKDVVWVAESMRRLGGHCGRLWDPSSYLILSSASWLWWGFVRRHAPAIMGCLATGPKTIEPTGHKLDPPKCWTEIHTFLYKLMVSRILLSARKLTTTPTASITAVIKPPSPQMEKQLSILQPLRNSVCRMSFDIDFCVLLPCHQLHALPILLSVWHDTWFMLLKKSKQATHIMWLYK